MLSRLKSTGGRDARAGEPDAVPPSMTILAELLRSFASDPQRPATWRIVVNSLLLFGSFALSIVVLFGLPVALIAVIESHTPGRFFHPLARFGYAGFEVTPAVIVFCYLFAYLVSIIFAFASRWMLARDYVRYVQRVTDAIVDDYVIAFQRNLYIPGLFLDRSLFNRIALSGGRALPRIYLVIMSGLIPLAFGILSLAAFLAVDFILGVIVVAIMALATPFLMRMADRSTQLNRDHAEDNKALSETFRDYSDIKVFLPEIEREAADGPVREQAPPTIEEFARKKTRFFESFEQKQIVQDNIRFVVGIATLAILVACFCYYLYVPWAEVRITALFVLVLSFRYFITALSGLSSSIVSLTSNYHDYTEVLAFRAGMTAARRSGVTEPLPETIQAFDLQRRKTEPLHLNELDVLEVVTGRGINTPTTIGNLAVIYGIDAPRFFDEVAMIGMPQKNYKKIGDLDQWVTGNLAEIQALLGMEPLGALTTAKQVKAAVEKHFFAERGLVLPTDLWNALSEWMFAHLTYKGARGRRVVVMNGELIARFPRVLRQLIIDKEAGNSLFLFYQNSKKIFVSEKHDRVGIVHNQRLCTVPRSTPEEAWRDLENQMKAKGDLVYPETPIGAEP